jgi:hypothetical protein
MTALEAVDLLTRICGFAQELLCRPLADPGARRERCEALETELEIAIAGSAQLGRFLDNGAPLLLTAIDRSLYRRHLLDEDGAADWDCLIGHLMPLVRRDAGRALTWLKEVSRG